MTVTFSEPVYVGRIPENGFCGSPGFTDNGLEYEVSTKFVFVYCLQTKLLRCREFSKQIKSRSFTWVDELDESANHYAFIRERQRTDGVVGCAKEGVICSSDASWRTSANLYHSGEDDLAAALVSYVPSNM